MAQVICPYCKEKFFKEQEEFVYSGNRYYHSLCYKKREEDREYREKIHEYCNNILPQYSKTRIDKQIKELLEDGTGKTLSGIYRSLVWHYEKNNGDPSRANGGIRIVAYIYEEAEKYYKQQYEIEKRNAELLNKVQESEIEVFHVRPQAIRKPKRVNLFSIT